MITTITFRSFVTRDSSQVSAGRPEATRRRGRQRLQAVVQPGAVQFPGQPAAATGHAEQNVCAAAAVRHPVRQPDRGAVVNVRQRVESPNRYTPVYGYYDTQARIQRGGARGERPPLDFG